MGFWFQLLMNEGHKLLTQVKKHKPVGCTMSKPELFYEDRPERLLRLKQVLKLIPVSRSSWYSGQKSGRYPAGFKIGPRTRVYRESEIIAIMKKLNDD